MLTRFWRRASGRTSVQIYLKDHLHTATWPRRGHVPLPGRGTHVYMYLVKHKVEEPRRLPSPEYVSRVTRRGSDLGVHSQIDGNLRHEPPGARQENSLPFHLPLVMGKSTGRSEKNPTHYPLCHSPILRITYLSFSMGLVLPGTPLVP